MIKYIKVRGAILAKRAINQARGINIYRTENLVMYGEPYRKTLDFAHLELLEKWCVLKSEIYIALFRLSRKLN